MIRFLILWLLAYATLAGALGLLSWIYNLCGGDLGLSGWKRETLIAAFTSAIQGLLFWFSLSLGVGIGRMYFLAVIMVFIIYKATHASSNVFEGAYEMDNGAIAAIA